MEGQSLEMLKVIGAGIACFGMIGAAIGVGNIFAAFLTGIARNPSAEQKMFKNAMIGAAMAEGLGILSFVIAMIMLFAI